MKKVCGLTFRFWEPKIEVARNRGAKYMVIYGESVFEGHSQLLVAHRYRTGRDSTDVQFELKWSLRGNEFPILLIDLEDDNKTIERTVEHYFNYRASELRPSAVSDDMLSNDNISGTAFFAHLFD